MSGKTYIDIGILRRKATEERSPCRVKSHSCQADWRGCDPGGRGEERAQEGKSMNHCILWLWV